MTALALPFEPVSGMTRDRDRGVAPVLETAYGLLMRSLEPPLAALQRRVGIKGMAYAFVLPNLLVFGIFGKDGVPGAVQANDSKHYAAKP